MPRLVYVVFVRGTDGARLYVTTADYNSPYVFLSGFLPDAFCWSRPNDASLFKAHSSLNGEGTVLEVEVGELCEREVSCDARLVS